MVDERKATDEKFWLYISGVCDPAVKAKPAGDNGIEIEGAFNACKELSLSAYKGWVSKTIGIKVEGGEIYISTNMHTKTNHTKKTIWKKVTS